MMANILELLLLSTTIQESIFDIKLVVWLLNLKQIIPKVFMSPPQLEHLQDNLLKYKLNAKKLYVLSTIFIDNAKLQVQALGLGN